jgi:hypothetical protein
MIPHMAAVSIIEERISQAMRKRGAKVNVETSGRAYAVMNMAFAAGMLVGPVWGGQIRERCDWLVMYVALGWRGWLVGFMALS